MARWTDTQVAQLAPDDAARAAARKLARPGPWSDLGSTDLLVWGKCQGSGKQPYQVSVDLTGPAFKCTCPSRKFPCKHGLALLMLWVAGEGSVAEAIAAPEFAADWLADRREKAGKAAKKADAKPPDPEAQAKRREQRIALMSAGFEDFERWLRDMVRSGLGSVRQQSYKYWDDAAARLVDAQLPGLADRVRQMSSAVHARADWTDYLLAEIGRWWTAARAWRRFGDLEPADVGNLRAYLGWAYSGDEVAGAEPVLNEPSARSSSERGAVQQWQVLGVHRSDDGRLQQQRTWLHGAATGETVLVLDFAAGGAPLAVPQVVGSVFEVAVARYPGSWPRRARFAGEPTAVDTIPSEVKGADIAGALATFADALAGNPWLDRVPITLAHARLAIDGDSYVVDADGRSLALVADAPVWQWLATTGGEPTNVFGELTEGRFRPLTLRLGGGAVGL